MRASLPSGTPLELVRPSGRAERGLVVAPDIGGLRPLFEELVARLADEQGWAVAAVEPFPGRESMSLADRMAAVGGLHDAEQVGGLVAAADSLEVEPVGVLGFCMGGMWAMKAAATLRFDRAVAFYGMIRNPPDWRAEHNADAIDALRSEPGAAGRVLGLFGTDDPFTPSADVDELEAAGATVARFEDAEHGFAHDPDRPAHRPDEAAEAWRRAVSWLRGDS